MTFLEALIIANMMVTWFNIYCMLKIIGMIK